jgi:hypothetical protein
MMESQRLSQISVIAAISSKGRFYFTINTGSNNSLSFYWFLLKLVKQLDIKDRRWRDHTVILLDNAPYHRSSLLKEKLFLMQVPIFFLGPY